MMLLIERKATTCTAVTINKFKPYWLSEKLATNYIAVHKIKEETVVLNSIHMHKYLEDGMLF